MSSGAQQRTGSASEKRSSTNQSRTHSSAAERRIERTSRVTRETITVRTKSPLKPASESRVNGRGKREGNSAGGSRDEPVRKKEDAPGLIAKWNPKASIIAHTTAPLASRISVPPLASTAPVSLQPQPLNQLAPEEQEKAVIEDLLFVFMGFEGQYIRYGEAYDPLDEKDRLLGPAFRILPGLDPSLRDLTMSMLKMATHYIGIEAFLEVLSREEYGSVNHALCAAVRKLIKDYLILMAQLEHQMLTNPTFTLHVLNLHTKPTSHMLFQIYNLSIELLKANSILEDDNDSSSGDSEDDLENILESLREGGTQGVPGKKFCKGGSTLGLITKRLASMSGDPSARTLLTTLLREASTPYMSMLNEWLHHGGIRDPHSEFLIKEQKSIKRERLDQDYTDEYWEKRYTVRENLVPPQLEGVKDKVLLAGKYLNVVRECGGVDISKEVRDVPTTFNDPHFLENVNAAYAYANSALLKLLLTTHALPSRLRSLKHYFFLDRSDFFTYFLELSASELKKPAREVNTGKLQSLLDIVLRQPGSVAADDPFKEDVKVAMNETSLTEWLMKIVSVTGLDQDAATGAVSSYTPAAAMSTTSEKDTKIIGFEALVLDYAVPFPLSLVVSRVTLTRYQLLFRYLLSLRHLETLLISAWADQSKSPAWKHRSANPRIESAKRKAFTLRARMLIFVQQLIYYCTAEVIEPNWQGLMSRLGSSDGKGEGHDNWGSVGAAETGVVGDGSSSEGKEEGVKRTVDELMQDHVDFLATCLKECMLTNSKLLKLNSKIILACTAFANYTSSFSRYIIAADPALAAKVNTQTTAPTPGSTTGGFDASKLEKLEDLLQRFDENFSRHLKILLDTLNYLAATETVVFLSLCARLSTGGNGGEGGGGGFG
ncbi:spindle pole body component 97 [Tothia fuscella]|uniref:Spindle pole body component n=1 Tax=Tothia fuscella TaxID=1048955 RepID=A0A9P4NFV9_9PEZI|nr:spindle pole body component 97 [Tothia fuscella]